MRKFNSGIDLVQTVLANALLHPLSAHPNTPTPKAGQLYFNTVDKTVYIYDGTSWINLFTVKASETLAGIVELATTSQISLGTDTENGNPLVVKPSQVKALRDEILAYYATSTIPGIVELATTAQITAGTDTESGHPLVVQPSQLKAKIDALTSQAVSGDLSGNMPVPVVEQSSSTDGFLQTTPSGSARLKAVGNGVMSIRNATDTAYGDFDCNDAHVRGNLTVDGIVKQVSTEELQLEDSILVLNNNETGTPSQNAGLEVERGTSTNATMLWNEASDTWVCGDKGSEIQIARKVSTNITGNGTLTSFTVTHGLNTTDVIVQMKNSSGEIEEADYTITNSTTVTIAFTYPPTNGAVYRVNIIG